MHCHVHSNLNPHSVNVQSTENSAKCLCQPPFTELCVCVCVDVYADAIHCHFCVSQKTFHYHCYTYCHQLPMFLRKGGGGNDLSSNPCKPQQYLHFPHISVLKKEQFFYLHFPVSLLLSKAQTM